MYYVGTEIIEIFLIFILFCLPLFSRPWLPLRRRSRGQRRASLKSPDAKIRGQSPIAANPPLLQ